MKLRLAIVVTLCLALGAAGRFGFQPEAAAVHACACGHSDPGGSPGDGARAPCIPCALCCPCCAGAGVASLPDSDGFWIDLAVARRADEREPAAEARRYPPPLPPPRARAESTPRIT